MKKVMSLFLALFVLGLTQTFAQEATSATPTQDAVAATATMAEDANTGAEVLIADLPEAVQTALKAEEFQDWALTKVLLVQKDDAQFYKLIMTRGDEERKVKLDAQGKPYKHAEEK